MKLRPPGMKEKRPKSAGTSRRKGGPPSPHRSKPLTRDGRGAIDAFDPSAHDMSETCKEILRGGYTLDQDQQEKYDASATAAREPNDANPF